MQSLIRSKSAGVTGGRGTAGAGPGRDLLYQSAEMSLHFLILPLNPPIIYLILYQGMVWYRFSIRLHAF